MANDHQEPEAVPSAIFIRVDTRALRGCRQSPERLRRIIDGELKPDRRVDVGDAWDGIHFLLSPRRRAGAVQDRGDPFGLAIFGGDLLNPYVLDRRQIVSCLEPRTVARVDRELQKITGGQLRRQYDPPAMEGRNVVPGGWAARGEEGFEYLLDAFLQWRELYHLAAEDNQAVLCALR